MPNYTFECMRCGGRHVVRVPIADRNKGQECPQCGLCLLVRVPDAPDFKVQGGTPKFHEKGRT